MTHVMKSGMINSGSTANAQLDQNEADADLAAARSTDGPAAPPVSNPWMFFRRWIANPLQMGSIVPSSPTLCGHVVKQVRRKPDQYVVELGAGTGVISRALLDSGLPPEKLYVVEIVPTMAAHLKRVLPGVNVISGDARQLSELLPPEVHNNIGSVICGIPLVLLPVPEQRRFIDAIEAVAPGVGFLHYSYCVTSPLPYQKHGLSAKREKWTPRNFPPASVWRYTPTA
jgi:phosphatidylethanolamine/phosphatidyl-N-methylethanolamine N-methyltransferase